jgi:hypothetical protein
VKKKKPCGIYAALDCGTLADVGAASAGQTCEKIGGRAQTIVPRVEFLSLRLKMDIRLAPEIRWRSPSHAKVCRIRTGLSRNTTLRASADTRYFNAPKDYL